MTASSACEWGGPQSPHGLQAAATLSVPGSNAGQSCGEQVMLGCCWVWRMLLGAPPLERRSKGRGVRPMPNLITNATHHHRALLPMTWAGEAGLGGARAGRPLGAQGEGVRGAVGD